jgi:hypothetical protein
MTATTTPAVKVTKAEARGYDQPTDARYDVTVDGRLLGQVVRYRHETPVLSGRIRVGAHARTAWQTEVDPAIARDAASAIHAALEGDDLRYAVIRLGNLRRAVRGCWTRKDALTELVGRVADLDGLATTA